MEAFLGIDINKGYADFTLLDPQGNDLEGDFRLDDTRQGHNLLKAHLEKLITTHGIAQLYCAVESTGGFENNWYNSLVQLGSNLPLKVARLNPAGIKHYSKAALNRNVTDALSARYIAQYLIAQNHKIDYSPQNRYYSSFRSLHTNINLLKSQRVQLINELKMLLYTAFPELTRYCKTGIADWVLELLPNQS